MTHLHLIYLFTLSLLIQLLPRRTRTPPGPAASLFPPRISFQHADALGIPITTHNALVLRTTAKHRGRSTTCQTFIKLWRRHHYTDRVWFFFCFFFTSSLSGRFHVRSIILPPRRPPLPLFPKPALSAESISWLHKDNSTPLTAAGRTLRSPAGSFAFETGSDFSGTPCEEQGSLFHCAVNVKRNCKTVCWYRSPIVVFLFLFPEGGVGAFAHWGAVSSHLMPKWKSLSLYWESTLNYSAATLMIRGRKKLRITDVERQNSRRKTFVVCALPCTRLKVPLSVSSAQLGRISM